MELLSYSKAKELGHKFYYSGKPCKHGNITKRYVTARSCTCERCTNEKYDRAKNTKIKI